jgi:hypothetical protein
MIQVVKGNFSDETMQLICFLSSKTEENFEIDFEKTYKIVNKQVYGTRREYCKYTSNAELVQTIPNSVVILIELSSDKNYVKILDEYNGIYWVHKYCLTQYQHN